MARITHFGVDVWCTRTVGSSGSKLKAKLGHISPAATRRAKSYIDLKPPEVARGRDPAFDIETEFTRLNGTFQYASWEAKTLERPCHNSMKRKTVPKTECTLSIGAIESLD